MSSAGSLASRRVRWRLSLLWTLLSTAILLAAAARRGRIQALHFGAID
jgi:hypothetical protein